MQHSTSQLRITMTTVQVLLFASARESAGGISKLDLTLPATNDDPTTTTTVREALAVRFPPLAPLVLDDESITLAVNEEYVPVGAVWPIASGDVVALIPPISGG
jgi:molybdopterin converting factor small subunit